MYELNTYQQRQAFYRSPSWKALRDYKLSQNPFCERCSKRGDIVSATQVHHLKDIREAPELSLSYNNLESLCSHCHSSHTITEINRKLKDNRKNSLPFFRLYHL